ncbi:MAG TPA: Ig-like domain-containing protein [Allosphingosinicella sp.]|nr:Ig-like domain-containing protein [Allosphingosinicella sp.]
MKQRAFLALIATLSVAAPPAMAADNDAAATGAHAMLAVDGDLQMNQPPTAVTDTRSVRRCTITQINVLDNDSDPEGNYPLTVTSVTGATIGTAWVWNGTSVYYESTITPGSETLTYTVQDSLGATSNGTIQITVSGGLINCV